MIDNIKVGKAIAELRQKQNLTQKQLADKLGVSDKAISKWERGAGLPDISLLSTLAMILDTDVESILEGNSSYKKDNWIGFMDLSKDKTTLYKLINNKPIAIYMIGYYMLAGISDIYIICEKKQEEFINKIVKDININLYYISSYLDVPNTNVMYVEKPIFIFGQSLTRSFQKAMERKIGKTILLIPSERESNDQLFFNSDHNLVFDKNDSIESAYYYRELPILFFTKGTFDLNANASLMDFVKNTKDMFVEPLFRGLIYIPLDCNENIEDADSLEKIIEKRDFKVGDLKEIEFRRGLK